MRTRVFLVRHGATTLSSEDRFAGSTDVPLGVEGRGQAERLADRLASAPLAAVYSSPMRRSIETAEIVARPHALGLNLVDGLREIDHGRWEGCRRADVQQEYPIEYATWERDPVTFAPLGGESGAQVLDRALPAMNAIVRAHAGRSVLVVSHKATNRLLIASLIGLDVHSYRERLEQLPACLNLLEFNDPGGVRLVLLNDVSHYSPTEVASGPPAV
jgi:broad specificity phosphatase PhoE